MKMTITEKVSYIKGLADGLTLDENNKQDKILKAIIDLLDDIALSVSDLEDGCAELGEQLDAVDEDLSAVEDLVYGEEDECDCCCDEDDDGLYSVQCPNCNDVIYLDEDMLGEDSVECPNCGFKFDLDEECDCEDCSDAADEDK